MDRYSFRGQAETQWAGTALEGRYSSRGRKSIRGQSELQILDRFSNEAALTKRILNFHLIYFAQNELMLKLVMGNNRKKRESIACVILKYNIY